MVFASESEMKIPTSFRFQRSVEEDRRRRGREHRPDYSDTQISLAIQASLETANADISRGSSFGVLTDSDHRETSEADSILRPHASLTTRDSEQSRLQTSPGLVSRNAPLEESLISFSPWNYKKQSTNIEECLWRGKKEQYGCSPSSIGCCKCPSPFSCLASSGSATDLINEYATSSRTSSSGSVPSSASASGSTGRPAPGNGVGPSNHASPSQNRAAAGNALTPSNHASSVQNKDATANGVISTNSGSSSGNTNGRNNGNHSTQAPNLVNGRSSNSFLSGFPPIYATKSNKSASSSQPFPKLEDVNTSKKSLVQNHGSGGSLKSDTSNFPTASANKLATSDFPPVSANKLASFNLPSISVNKLATSSQPMQKVEDIKTANKSLVERIRACLGYDEDKYSAFREISVEYRRYN